ncbi:MAG: cytochrome c nitrite reductase small subunit [Candidatus Riflebacteria bacterium]|nr:cytochrome c nitrite reductase small subunit [Candidatus Riflebacteria bacterium]
MSPSSRALAVLLGAVIGACGGLGMYTFVYAKGASYLTNDPAACANCHVMRGHHDAWLKGSHRSVATCNDCHLSPHLAGKLYTKASNGFWHSYGFTTGWFPDPIRIKGSNRAVVEATCRKCHQDIVEAIDSPANHRTGESCVRCHQNVGHETH